MAKPVSSPMRRINRKRRKPLPGIEPSSPRYAAIAAALQQRIREGVYPVGSQMPPERKLAEIYSVALLTMRQALRLLADRGLIARRHGHGTFAIRQYPMKQHTVAGRANSRPVFLFGLRPGMSDRDDPVNWESMLLRLEGITEAGVRQGMLVRTMERIPPDFTEPAILRQLAEASGILLHAEELPPGVLQQLRQQGIPVVAINCYLQSACCNCIQVDMRQGVFLATQHLLELGHRRIGFIGGDPSLLTMRLRLEGYCDAMASQGVAWTQDLLRSDPRGLAEDGAAAAADLLALPSPPTAIVAASDRRALGVLQAAAARGVRVPQQLSVVGYDDIPEARLSAPPLTTIRNPIRECGYKAMEFLAELIRSASQEIQTRIMPVRLEIRGTTCPPQR